MNVLWFTNTPCLAEDFFNEKSVNGGFLKTLNEIVQDKVNLSIAFYYKKDIKPFRYGNTMYFPIYKNSDSLTNKIKSRVLGRMEPEEDIKKFIEIIIEIAPDVIHIHGTERQFGLIQNFISIPTVISIQGNISVYKEKYFSGIPLLDVFKYTRLKNRLFFTGTLSRFKSFKKQAEIEKRILRISKNIIGRTDWDQRITRVLSPNSNYFHNDEILKKVFYENQWQNQLSSKINLFTTTAAGIYKGVETLIHCAYLLDLNDVNYKWKVAGVSVNDEIVDLSTKSLKKNISKNIEFLGPVDEETLKDSILNCNIYLGVSHIENSPNSLCEALLLGAPCIATYAGGTSNFIQDRISGVLIQDGDPYSMAGAIMELKSNYDMAQAMGENARNIAIKRHDRNIIVRDLISIYQKVSSTEERELFLE